MKPLRHESEQADAYTWTDAKGRAWSVRKNPANKDSNAMVDEFLRLSTEVSRLSAKEQKLIEAMNEAKSRLSSKSLDETPDVPELVGRANGAIDVLDAVLYPPAVLVETSQEEKS